MKSFSGFLLSFIWLLFSTGAAPAQAPQRPLPVPGVRTMTDIPSAKELPDPALEYKIVFNLSAEPGHDNESNSNLEFIAGIVNTFANCGVSQTHRHFVIVLHGDTAMLAASDDAYRKLNGGRANASRAMMTLLEDAGVQMVACGQSALSSGISPEMIDKRVQLNLSATITFMNLGVKGYVRIPA